MSMDEVSYIPRTDKDITEAWVQKVVGITPIPNSLSVQGNIQDGNGFLSYMCRVTFQSEENGKHHIIVKLLPPSSSDWQYLAINGNFHRREIQFYEAVMPKLIEVDPTLQENMCKFYCAKYADRSGDNAGEGDPASILVMEDLGPLGYETCSIDSDLWEENLTKVIKCLARLHCASWTLQRNTNSKISEMFSYTFGNMDTDKNTWLKYAKTNVAEKVDPLLEKYNGSAKVRAVFKQMAPDLERNFSKTMKETMKNPCLIHGDLWYGNIMIHEKSDAPVKLIDWQLFGYRDPTTEISCTIMACIPQRELRKETITRFAHLYYQTCLELGHNLGKSIGEFQESFDTWGMAYAYLWYLLAIGTCDELEKRTCLIFDILHNEYSIDEFLKNACK